MMGHVADVLHPSWYINLNLEFSRKICLKEQSQVFQIRLAGTVYHGWWSTKWNLKKENCWSHGGVDSKTKYQIVSIRREHSFLNHFCLSTVYHNLSLKFKLCLINISLKRIRLNKSIVLSYKMKFFFHIGMLLLNLF